MEGINILIGLDELMDTRMSTMLSINSKKAIETISLGYGRRRGDWVIWEGLGITEEQWTKAYKSRQSEILMKSVRTKIFTFLTEIINEILKSPQITGNKGSFKMTINEYPYRLSPKVKTAFASLIKSLLLPTLEIKWIRQSDKLLEPSVVSGSYSHFIHYELINWLEMHMEKSQGSDFLKLQLIGPTLFSVKPESKDFETFKGVIDNVHELGEYFLAPSWNIKFISTEYFNTPF